MNVIFVIPWVLYNTFFIIVLIYDKLYKTNTMEVLDLKLGSS